MNEAEFLNLELERFRSDRERVRRIIGRIGGAGDRGLDRLINAAFLVVVAALFAASMARELFGLDVSGLSSIFSLEIAVLLVSAKIIWMIRRETKVEHFQFWILNSIEYQVGEIQRRLREIEKKAGAPGP